MIPIEINSIIVMCAITLAGGWDCGEEWILVVADGYGVWDPRDEQTFRKGVSVYDPWRYPIWNSFPDIDKRYGGMKWMAVGGDLNHDNCWAHENATEKTDCLPIIWHEIKHQQCECNWHKNMTKTFTGLKIFN